MYKGTTENKVRTENTMMEQVKELHEEILLLRTIEGPLQCYCERVGMTADGQIGMKSRINQLVDQRWLKIHEALAFTDATEKKES